MAKNERKLADASGERQRKHFVIDDSIVFWVLIFGAIFMAWL